MTKEQFENKCYEAYQLDWMISHGYSLSDYRKLLSELASECIEEEPIEKLPTNAEETKNLFDAAEEMFQDEGFGSGSLFVCKEDWILQYWMLQHRKPQYWRQQYWRLQHRGLEQIIFQYRLF